MTLGWAYNLKLHVLLLSVLRWRTTAVGSTCRQRHRSTFPRLITTGAPYQLQRAHFGHPYTCTAPLPITTGALQILFGHPSSLHTSYQTPRGHRKYTLFGHLLFLLPSTTWAPLIHTPHALPISTDAHSLDTPLPLHSSTTNLHDALFGHPLHTPSYCRSTAFGLSRSLSRVQAGVAAP